MEALVSDQISAEIVENLDVIEKVAKRSKNLKGTFVRKLHKSVTVLKAASRALAARTFPALEGDMTEMDRRCARGSKSLRARWPGTATTTRTREEPSGGGETDQEEEARPYAGNITGRRERPSGPERRGFGTAKGRQAEIPAPSIERTLEDARKVLEGVCLESVVTDDPMDTVKNLENLIVRCEGIKATLPTVRSERKQDADKPSKAADSHDGNAQPKPRVVAVEAVNVQIKRTRTPQRAAKKDGREETAKQKQALASQPAPRTADSWVEVVKRGSRRNAATQPAALQKPTTLPKKTQGLQGKETKGGTDKPTPQSAKTVATKTARRRNPRTQAVVLTAPPTLYGECMGQLKAQIKLEDYGIQGVKPRRSMIGALVFEIPGEGAKDKAVALSDKMKSVLVNREGVKVTRPQKMAELRIKDLDDSISEEEVRGVVAREAECDPTDVRVGKIRVAPNGLGTAWVQCPLTEAKKVSAKRRIRIGWVIARVEILEARPLVC
ncbi:PREDICTED: uncharacterized protein LOC105556182 [Vollenhovia emeryi]|uniref:uncharacterized protein LOC105556182 n=1 Tax=Vollenhovia emeryi TaxID=411798 RepID=UPI0005F3631B|nr:PREDICTED: uncharacterized protein LOC105556182 [Vollenhovia emeryi]